ncbi:MAG: DNA polymerase III subunit delta' [Agarilytica sp.]
MTSSILPMPPFEWLKPQWSDFCTRLERGKLPHAFLLNGQEGIGIEELALAMGQYLLCLSPMEGIACGRCRGCQLLQSETHPDLKRLEPEEKGKVIKVDQIREITAFVDKTAQQGGRKVILLMPAEAMNVNAANALLKSLEEPSGDTVFVLVSQQAHRVLPTIRSRCAQVHVKSPSQAQSLEWLSSVGVENPSLYLAEASGAPLLAKRWLDEGLFEERMSVIEGLTALMEGRSEPMATAKQWSNKDPNVILNPMLLCLELILSEKMAGKSIPEHYEAAQAALSRCSTTLLFRLRDRLCERKAQYRASPNLNAALFIEELILDWTAVV